MKNSDTTILRSAKSKEDPYVRFDRLTAQDANLSFAARGLLLYVFSKPQNWKAKLFDLQREGDIGKDALNTILNDLQRCGYIERTETRDGRGRFRYKLMVYESPDLNPDFTGADFPHRHRGGLSATGKSAPVIEGSTCAGARPSPDHKELREISTLAPLASPTDLPDGSAVTQSPAFSVAASVRVSNGHKPSRQKPKGPVLLPPPDVVATTPEFQEWLLKVFPRWDTGKIHDVVDIWRNDRLAKGLLLPAERWTPDMKAFMLRFKQNENGGVKQ